MAEIKDIIVPTDFSENARTAEESAFLIAKNADARIHFMHSIEAPAAWDHVRFKKGIEYLQNPADLEEYFPELQKRMKEVKKAFEELERKAADKKIRCKTHLLFDRTFDDLTELVKETDAGLVVMGVSGKKGKRPGSNTLSVIRNAELPVLLLRDQPLTNSPKNAFLASDFYTGDEVEQQMTKLADFCKVFKLEYDLLYVNTPLNFKSSDEISDHIGEFTQAVKCTYKDFYIQDDYHPQDGIKAFAKRQNSELIILTTRERSGLNYLFHDSVAEKLVRIFSTPLLILK